MAWDTKGTIHETTPYHQGFVTSFLRIVEVCQSDYAKLTSRSKKKQPYPITPILPLSLPTECSPLMCGVTSNIEAIYPRLVPFVLPQSKSLNSPASCSLYASAKLVAEISILFIYQPKLIPSVPKRSFFNR